MENGNVVQFGSGLQRGIISTMTIQLPRLEARVEEMGQDITASFKQLADYQIAMEHKIDTRFSTIETELTTIKNTMVTKADLLVVEGRIDSMEGRIDSLGGRL